MFKIKNVFAPVFVDPSNTGMDYFVPELWAQEGLALLEENMVAANLVHRDYEDAIAQYGDTVNIQTPAAFTASRKGDDDEVTVQAAVASQVQVSLNQHIHTSFIIKDGQESKSFKSLVDTFLSPAVVSIAQAVDQIVCSQVHQFIVNDAYKYAYLAGGLGNGSSTYIKDYILDAREIMNTKKVPILGRKLLITPNTESEMLKVAAFTEAEKMADGGLAMREASLGRRFGFDIFMAQNQPAPNYLDIAEHTTNDKTAAAAAIGATTITMAASHGGVVGAYMKIAGDLTPQLVTGVATNDLTISPGLKRAVASGAQCVFYLPGAVDSLQAAADSALGILRVASFHATLAPKAGQFVQIGSAAGTIAGTAAKYGIISVAAGVDSGDYVLTLDRPLSSTDTTNAASGNVVAIGPSGQYNMAFVKEAIALVTRPLALPRTGALAANVSYNNLSMRVVITYDGRKQGHLVTLDVLAGIKTLDTNRGVCLLG